MTRLWPELMYSDFTFLRFTPCRAQQALASEFVVLSFLDLFFHNCRASSQQCMSVCFLSCFYFYHLALEGCWNKGHTFGEHTGRLIIIIIRNQFLPLAKLANGHTGLAFTSTTGEVYIPRTKHTLRRDNEYPASCFSTFLSVVVLYLTCPDQRGRL
jgi:hypothetical protein